MKRKNQLIELLLQNPSILSSVYPQLTYQSSYKKKEDLQTEFLWLLSLLGIILTPLDFSSIAFFTERNQIKPLVGKTQRDTIN